MDDTQRELERIEQELLSEEELYDENDEQDLIAALMPETKGPAFDDPEKIHEPDGPLVYSNFSNDYGKKPTEDPEKKDRKEKMRQKKRDKTLIGLMLTACLLCVGILGVLVYWMEAFLK